MDTEKYVVTVVLKQHYMFHSVKELPDTVCP